jgi:hypothetical protein
MACETCLYWGALQCVETGGGGSDVSDLSANDLQQAMINLASLSKAANLNPE